LKFKFKKHTIFVFFLAFSLIFGGLITYAKGEESDLAKNFIRLHIIANSDTEADQNLKLNVRNAVLDYINSIIEGCKNIDDARKILNENLENIEKLAKDEIAKNNFCYDASVQIGNFKFPTKQYGNIILPAGVYEALEIRIGAAAGKNWWCVLFPPLCFVNGTVVDVSSPKVRNFCSSITDKQCDLITKSGVIPKFNMKFKIIEIFAPMFEKSK
jgi:stage II sporulation protein R